MKNLGRNIILVALMFGTMSVKAGNASNNSEIDPSVTVLKYLDVKKGYNVSVKDNHGIVLYKEKIQEEGKYIKGFDFTTLPNGIYSFELDREFEIQVKPFIISEGAVELLKEENHKIFKPVIRKTNGFVFVSHLALNEEVKIEILNNGSLIYSDAIENQLELRKIFDFSESPINDYIVIVSTKDRRFKKKIRL